MNDDLITALKSVQINDTSITIMTYNILAPSLTKSSWFPYCPRKYLNWKHRRSHLLVDVFAHDADIICLQEVEHYKDTWRPQFEKRGYIAYFHHKPAPKMYGLVFAFKKNRFVKVEYSPIFFCQHVWTENTSSLAQIIVLRDTVSDLTLVVANTHLWWAPEGGDADRRFFQAALLYQKMKSAVTRLSLPIGRIAGFCCGDFNSTPLDAVYGSLTQSLSDAVLVKKKLNIKNGCEKYFDDAFGLFHEKSWECAYSSTKLSSRKDRMPLWTNYTKLFKGVLDYIFSVPLGKPRVKLVALNEQPEEKISKQVGLPNIDFPSDHLPVVATFEIQIE